MLQSLKRRKEIVMRNYLVALVALFFAFGVAISAAHAQTFEIGAKIGVWSGDDMDNAAPAGKDNDDYAFTYGLIGQYNIDENWSVRLDIELGTSDYVDTTCFVLSGVYNFPIEESAFMPFVRAGVVIADVDVDFSGAPDYDTEFGFELAVGVSYPVENWKIFAELGYRDVSFDGTALVPDFDLPGFIFNIGATFTF